MMYCFKMECRYIIFIHILLYISIFINPSFQKKGEPHHQPHHGVILDAGSSSIKVRIYKWSWNHENPSNVPNIHLVKNERIRVNLARFVREPDMLELQIVNAVDVADRYINNTDRHDELNQIPLYLLSTAGSRTLTGHDARLFVRTVRRFLSNSTINPFHFTNRHVQILSGEEEGVYSWLSINYLLGFFNTTGPAIPAVGILELGGGSTQIAFVPHEPLYDGEFHIYVAKRRYELYAHSYLNFGQNFIKSRVTKWLFHHHHEQNSTYIPDPCRLEGDEIKQSHHNKTHVFYGIGNYTECQHIIKTFIKKAEGDSCSPKPCAIGQVYQPSVSNTTFYAVGAFKYAPSNLGALDESRRLNITKLQIMTEIHCSKNMSHIVKQEKRFASEFCLMGAYLSLLLTNAYGFSETTSNIITSDRVHGKKTDWSLGVMLHEVLEQQTLNPFTPVVEIHCPNLSQSVDSSASKLVHFQIRAFPMILLITTVHVILDCFTHKDMMNY